MLSGYMHPAYAASLAEFGRPLELPACKGWLLRRSIPGLPYHDAMGCYPLFACRDWKRFKADLDALPSELVTISLVTDPFGDFSVDHLRQCFDVVKPFKKHFIVDLHQPRSKIVSKDHQKSASTSLRKGVEVKVVRDPLECVDDWWALYNVLIKRHNINGIRAFSRASFSKQLRVPGLIMFKALYGGAIVGASLVFVQNNIGYVHLTAYRESGYELRASCALHWFKIEYFADRLRWLVLGGGSGVSNDPNDGLSQYKKGWSTGTKSVYFCGRIMDPDKYEQIVKSLNRPKTEYFPAYRLGEF